MNRNWSLERVWSGIGWGLALILVGVLILADNRGWTQSGEGWWYFAIGLGVLLIIGFTVRYFANTENRWKSSGGLVIGLALVYAGAVFLNGLGDWWPLALIPIGAGYVVNAFRRFRSASLSQINHDQESPRNIPGN